MLREKGFGGVSCKHNCRNYAWDGTMLLTLSKSVFLPAGIRLAEVLRNYRGHHPRCPLFAKEGGEFTGWKNPGDLEVTASVSRLVRKEKKQA